MQIFKAVPFLSTDSNLSAASYTRSAAGKRAIRPIFGRLDPKHYPLPPADPALWPCPRCVMGRESFYLPRLEAAGTYSRLGDPAVIQVEGTGDERGVLFFVRDDGVGF